MPILLIILLAIVITQIGFWKTLSAVLGAVLMVMLFVLFVIVFLGLAAYVLFRRMWRQF